MTATETEAEYGDRIRRAERLTAAAEKWMAEQRASGRQIPDLKLSPAEMVAIPSRRKTQFGSVITLDDRWHYGWHQFLGHWSLLDGPGYDECSGQSVTAPELATAFGWPGA